ncbi:MAG: MarR family transcriptional regulator [Bacillota bacterium]|nr:MarR family transcriptional regulator [Bacillota bacterium]
MSGQCKVDLLDETGQLIRKIWQDYEEYLMPYSRQISPHQLYFLNYLQRKKTVTPSEIAEQFGITLGAVTGFVDRLYKLGLIKRTRSEEDRRLVLIELTAEGQKRLEEFYLHQKEAHAEIIKRMSEREIQDLNQALGKFAGVLNELTKRE